MKKILSSILDAVGETPLVRLNRLVRPGMADVLVKIESLNPGGSVKDRMACHLVKMAEKRGELKPGISTLVEATSGNTGLGLAMMAAVRGYKCMITIPDKMSQEKINMLRAYGAEVIVTPASAGHDSPDFYKNVAKRIVKETPSAMYMNQYDNPDNPVIHYETTGPEIWEQTDGKLDYFVAGIGTGGTVTGVGRFLRDKSKATGKTVKVVCADPVGSVLGAIHRQEKNIPEAQAYKVEGIGQDFVPKVLDFSVIHEVRPVTDQQSFVAARRLCREEGIFVGGSAGTAIHTALELAAEVGAGKTIVVLLPDSGDRYVSKCFNDQWMKDHGFLEEDRGSGTVNDVLNHKGRGVEFAAEHETLGEVAARLNQLGISQMPIRESGDAATRIIHEIDILHALVQGKIKADQPISHVARPIQGIVSPADSLHRLEGIFESGNAAIVKDGDKIIGVLCEIDVVRYLTTNAR
ncbi:pyridoxal-phosphate dependent enzyme [bacterium]|nr:pyridoxal-phosphate dependent enzyme [bacterium]